MSLKCFKRHVVSSLLLVAVISAQPVAAVEFNEAQAAAIAREEISVSDPGVVAIDAMQTAPAPAYQAVDAEEQLNNYLFA